MGDVIMVVGLGFFIPPWAPTPRDNSLFLVKKKTRPKSTSLETLIVFLTFVVGKLWPKTHKLISLLEFPRAGTGNLFRFAYQNRLNP